MITPTTVVSQRQTVQPSSLGQLGQTVDKSEPAGPPPMPIRRPPPTVPQHSPSSPALLPARRPPSTGPQHSPLSPARSAKSASSGDVPQLSDCGASSIRCSASATGSTTGTKERRVKEPPPHISKKAGASSTCAGGSGGHGSAPSPPPLRSPPAKTSPSQVVEALEVVCQSHEAVVQQQSNQQEKRCEQRWADSEPSGGDEFDQRGDILDSLGADAMWAQEVEGPPSKAPPPQSPIYRVMPAPPEARALNETMPLPPSTEDQAETSPEATPRSSAPTTLPKYKAMPSRAPPPKCGVSAVSGRESSPPSAWSVNGGENGSVGPPPAPSSTRAAPVEPKRYKAPPAECAFSSTDSDFLQGNERTCVSEKHPPGAWDSWQGAKSPPEPAHRIEERNGQGKNGSCQQKRVKAPPQRPQ